MRQLLVVTSLVLSGCFLTGYDRLGTEPEDDEDAGGMDAGLPERRDGGKDGGRDAGLDAGKPERDADVPHDGGDDVDADAGGAGDLDGATDAGGLLPFDGGPRDGGLTPRDGGDACGEGGCSFTPLVCDGGTCTGDCKVNTAYDGKVDCTFDCRATGTCSTHCPTGASCNTHCNGVGLCLPTCDNFSFCAISCESGARCLASCAPGAVCVMRCAAGTTCAYDYCPAPNVQKQCDGGVVCGQECP